MSDTPETPQTITTIPAATIEMFDPNNFEISFRVNDEEIGALDFNGPKMVFTGEAEQSAQIFVDWIAYVFANRLEQERQAERVRMGKSQDNLRYALSRVLAWGGGPADHESDDQKQRYHECLASAREILDDSLNYGHAVLHHDVPLPTAERSETGCSEAKPKHCQL